MNPARTFRELQHELQGQPTAITIGAFDGVHLGHQALIGQTIELARSHGAKSVAITFSNHPLSVLAPPYRPRMLLTPERKVELLYSAGLDHVLALEFTREFAKIPPEQFIVEDLVGAASLKHLVCGYDFTFGRRGEGNLELLNQLGPAHGFSVTCVQPVTVGPSTVKSTRIRDHLSSGEVEQAAILLTRPHEVPGRVVTGHQRGRTIGFPTANLQPPPHYQWPARGVYACAATVENHPAPYAAMVNIGVTPTFGEQEMTMEAHLLDFSADITGQPLTLQFFQRLRDEQKFSGVDALVAQLHQDRDHTRAIWNQLH